MSLFLACLARLVVGFLVAYGVCYLVTRWSGR